MKAMISLLLGACIPLFLGCVTPQEQAQQNRASVKAWINGPFAALCRDHPGPGSQRACRMVIERFLLETDGIQLSREEHYNIELAKFRSGEELRRLWTVDEHQAWLRGPYTAACNQAPFPAMVASCLSSVQRDLDTLSLRGHEPPEDSPEIRAERAVTRIEAQQRSRAIASQRQHELDLARTQAAGMILQGYALTGGPLRGLPSTPPAQFQPPPAFTPAPVIRSAPPIDCTSTRTGAYTYTNCY